jgi:hypothetical protein
MLLAMVGIVVIAAGFVRSARLPAPLDVDGGSTLSVPQSVRVGDEGLIAIEPGSALLKHLKTIELAPVPVRSPVLTVSGNVLARIRGGEGAIEDRWQFANSELATSYSDWLRTRGEVQFSTRQLEKTRELSRAETGYLEANVNRLEPLFKNGNLPERDYKAAQADLLKAQLQGEKDVFAAESAQRVATNALTAIERDLAREGIDPQFFSRPRENLVLVGVQIPESRVSDVESGQRCLARFYAFRNRTFQSQLQLLNSQLTHERRTMRALLEIEDSEDRLRPGMFAEINIGTDERQAILIPAEALVRLCKGDYLFVQSGTDWRPVLVRVGPQQQGQFEILEGATPGETIVTHGAILLKPVAARIVCEPFGEFLPDSDATSVRIE